MKKTKCKPVSPVMAEKIQRWPVDRLIPYARNTRTHSDRQVAEVADSIAEFGFVHPVLVGPEGVIVAGHCRVLAAQQLGIPTVPVIILDHLSEVQRQALRIADNRLALNAGWDEELLRSELAALEAEEFPVDLLGFDDAELNALLAGQDDGVVNPGEEAVPEPPQVPVSMAGDVWRCGEHRVLCGDPLAISNIGYLIRGDLADVVLADLRVSDLSASDPQSPGSSAEWIPQFLTTLFSNCRGLAKPDASLYVFHPPAWQREFQNALESAGFALAAQIIWARQAPARTAGHYQIQHDPILYAHVAGQDSAWHGGGRQSTLWTGEQPVGVRGMPVELVDRALMNSSRKGDLVADLSAGFGSTLIACERLGRRGRLMEEDPRLADVTVVRWQRFARQSAVLEGTGQNFDDVAEQRRRAA